MQTGYSPDASAPAAAGSPLAPPSAAPTGRNRLNSIDCLRGLVMIVMALDHTRDYLAPGGQDFLRDVHHPALFLTRWITHFCAPTFVFLAGVGAFLFGARVANRAVLSRFLLTRGFWLVICELTLVRFGWTFHLAPQFMLLQVIWVIGCSMIFLSGLVFLPRLVLVAGAVALIGGHNLLDGIDAASLGRLRPVWILLHQRGLIELAPGVQVFALYPLIPWVAVMLAGYLTGPVFLRPAQDRTKTLAMAGGLVVLFFVGLRASNFYGDPGLWHSDPSLGASVLSFVNCEKYPPSLLYLAMTLGPALLALAAFDGVQGRGANFLVTFGRVPFFFYLGHIYLIHTIAVAVALLRSGPGAWDAGFPPRADLSPNFGLPVMYLFWFLIVLALYPLCRWFGRIKETRRAWWLSYL
jgi:uncharacterized membrane protein